MKIKIFCGVKTLILYGSEHDFNKVCCGKDNIGFIPTKVITYRNSFGDLRPSCGLLYKIFEN